MATPPKTADGGVPAIVRVAVPSPLRAALDYLPPAGWRASEVATGARVRVPLGHTTKIGVVVGHAAASTLEHSRLRRISAVIDDTPLFPDEMLDFLAWVSRYFHHPLGEVVAEALPGLLRSGHTPRDARYRLTEAGRASAPDSLARAPRQKAIVARLRAGDPDGMERGSMGGSATALRALIDKGLVERHTAPPAIARDAPRAPPHTASERQRTAIDVIDADHHRFGAYLLDGVTGSGKTEVYLQLIERTLARGRQALVLIPEIGLTPQTAARLRERLPARSVVLHSALAEGERARGWLAAARGDADVVIGTRSAVLVPLPRMGLIVVDEEHDLSYKQQDGLRYSARDLAVVRAHRTAIPVVLGSATPSLESLHNVARGRYRHLLLPERAANLEPPAIEIVDMRGQPQAEGLSGRLAGAIEHALAAGEQVILFLNRRGYAPVMMCHACGQTVDCSRCDAHMVLHRDEGRLRCHHCDAVTSPPVVCPHCQAATPRAVGVGTQRLVEALQRRFPGARIARMDRDSTRARGRLQALVDDVHTDRLDILVGTQMLAKGHHFPRVTLVGVVDADGGLFSVDFRAAERLAQLIVQVAGRAGRGERGGQVMVQTHQPQHPLLLTLVREGYARFAQTLLRERADARLPPVSAWALLRADATSPEPVYGFLREARALGEARRHQQVALLGPVAAPMERRAGRHRVQLLVDARRREPLHRFLDQWLPDLEALASARRVRWSVDVDPQEMV